MRLRRLRRWWPVPVILLITSLLIAAWPGRWTFTVSPETTYATEPVDAEGYIDYPTALNRRLSDGIRPEENANVLIWQALGPHPEGGTMPAEYFTWLGVESPPELGEYFIPDDYYFRTEIARLAKNVPVVNRDDRDRQELWNNRLSRTRKWPWKADEHPDIADWLKKNEKPLAVAFEASRRPKYFNPLISKSKGPESPRLIGSLLPNVQLCRAIGNALTNRSMLRAGQGDLDGAWQDLLTCQRLGRLILQRGTIIEGLVGTALVAIATNGQTALLGSCRATVEQLTAWLEDLRQLPPMALPADKIDQVERFFTLDALLSIIATGSVNLESIGGSNNGNPDKPIFWDRLFSASIDWDQAFRNINKLYDDLSAAGRLRDRAARKSEFKRIVAVVVADNNAAKTLDFVDKMSMGPPDRGVQIGNILIGLFLPAFDKIQDSSDRSIQTQRNLQVALALATFHAESGRYPARLDELAPKYLPEVPKDLFTGQPLIYRPTSDGYLLYSVGINGVDDDGRSTDDEPNGDDLVVRMPPREPTARKAE